MNKNKKSWFQQVRKGSIENIGACVLKAIHYGKMGTATSPFPACGPHYASRSSGCRGHVRTLLRPSSPSCLKQVEQVWTGAATLCSLHLMRVSHLVFKAADSSWTVWCSLARIEHSMSVDSRLSCSCRTDSRSFLISLSSTGGSVSVAVATVTVVVVVVGAWERGSGRVDR